MLLREMEKLKEPAMLLSVANSIGLVGTTAYFYKQLEAVRLDMVKMSQTLQGVLRKLSEIEKGDQNKGEALHTLNDQIKRINDQLEDIPSINEIDGFDLDLSEIVTILSENSIQVERPSQNIRYTRRSGDRKSRRDLEVEDRRDTQRKPARGQLEASRTSRNDSSRDYERQPSRSSNVPTREVRGGQHRSEPTANYDEDDDLIGEVRRQQTRN
jgi:hypothetical protein